MCYQRKILKIAGSKLSLGRTVMTVAVLVNSLILVKQAKTISSKQHKMMKHC